MNENKRSNKKKELPPGQMGNKLKMKKKQSGRSIPIQKRAENGIILEKKTKPVKISEKMTSKELEKTLSELRKNQAQLEIQNKELRKTQQELQVSREKYLDLYDNAPVGYLTISESGQVKEANQTVEILLGVNHNLLLGQPLSRYLYSEDHGIFNKHRKQVSMTGSTQTCELRMLKQDGTKFFAHLESSAAKDQDGKSVCRIVLSDITDHKQTEIALSNAHWRMESILEGAHIGTWEWNVQTGRIAVNERWAYSIGYTSDELDSISIKTWLALTHPEDRKKSVETQKQYFAGKLSYYDCEYRVKHKQGHWLWVRVRGSIITRTRNKKPLMMFGTYTDITERKQAEEALKLRESHLTAIIENQHGLVWLKDKDGKFLVVNTAFALSLGKKDPREVVGLTELDLNPKELAEKYTNEDAEVIKQKKPLRFQESVFCKDSIKWFETFRRPIFDKAGKVIGTTGFKFFQGDKH